MSLDDSPELLRESCYKSLRASKLAKAHVKKIKKAYGAASAISEDSESKAQDAIETYAQLTCQALINKIHATLPRELRDAVWRALLPSWPIEIYYDNDVTTSHGDKHEGKSWHLMRDEYMGEHTILEIQEEYFRSTRFYFISDTGAKNFRTVDPLELGVLAADSALNVEFEYHCELYAFAGIEPAVSPWNGGGGWGGGGGWVESLLETKELLARLECLIGFKKGSTITINLKVEAQQVQNGTSEQELLWNEVIPFIRPTLRKLSLAGRKITVRMNDEYWRFEPPGPWPSPADWKRVVDEVEEDENDIYLGIEDLFSSSQD